MSSMNRLLFEAQAATYRIERGDPRFEHVRGTLRAQLGDTYDIGVLNGPLGRGQVIAIDAGGLTLQAEWAALPTLTPDIDVLMGYCRPASMNRILRSLPTLGVRRLVLVPTDYSVPGYARQSGLRPQAVRSKLCEGLEQCYVDTRLPEVICCDALEAGIRCLEGVPLRILLHLFGHGGELGCTPLADGPAVLAIGPDRGWGMLDLACLDKADYRCYGMGSRVLRVDTALVAAVARLQVARQLP